MEETGWKLVHGDVFLCRTRQWRRQGGNWCMVMCFCVGRDSGGDRVETGAW